MSLQEAKAFTRWLVSYAMYFALALLGINTAFNLSPLARDDTDPVDGRSGLRLYTDARTGCQYLGQREGGLTPRIDREGHAICTTPEQKP